jgi:hypothetical protein
MSQIVSSGTYNITAGQTDAGDSVCGNGTINVLSRGTADRRLKARAACSSICAGNQLDRTQHTPIVDHELASN